MVMCFEMAETMFDVLCSTFCYVIPFPRQCHGELSDFLISQYIAYICNKYNCLESSHPPYYRPVTGASRASRAISTVAIASESNYYESSTHAELHYETAGFYTTHVLSQCLHC